MTTKEILTDLSQLATLDPIKQFFFYKNLSENGFSEEEIEQIKVAVAFHVLFSCPEKYKNIKQAFKESYALELYNTLRKETV